MNYSLRLTKGNHYLADLKAIIDSIKVNGNKAQCHSIVVSHPEGYDIELFMNFGLEQNSCNPPVKYSLNILGFKNSKSQEFTFNINPFPCIDLNFNAKKLNIDGTYKSLGFPMQLPKIKNIDLLNSIQILNNFSSSNEIGKQECEALARLIIITSEAIRFTSVANGIKNILENENEFTPNSFEIIGWGGHSIAS